MTRSWLVLLLAFTGCQCAGTEVDTHLYHCAADGDCAAGFFCASSVCVADGTVLDAGSTDGGGNADASADAGGGDGGADGGTCTPESDQQLCASQGYVCGTLTAADNCGTVRTTDCGGCPLGDSCEDGGHCVTVLDGGPCPGGVMCGSLCCQNGESCVAGVCCNVACGTGCCTSTQTCVGTACCPNPKACGGICCGVGLYCINAACCTQAGFSWEQVNSSGAVIVGTQRTVKFAQDQGLGNLNVVVIGIGDVTTQVTSVTDSAGNTYLKAIGPTVGTGLSQSIYYAADIAAAVSGNTVTITFNQAPAGVDIRIAEVGGVALVAPFDTADGGAGSGPVARSGEVTTGAPHELVIGAGIATGGFADAGNNGFVLRLMSPADNLIESKVIAFPATGSATAYPKAGSPNDWVMQIVAFKGC